MKNNNHKINHSHEHHYNVERCHYSKSKIGAFPFSALTKSYKETAFRDLVPSRSHMIGSYVQELDIRYWSNISLIINHFMRLSVDIKEINMSGNVEVSDEFMELLTHSFDLNSINIGNCTNISPTGLILTSTFKSLLSLYVNGVSSLTDDVIDIICMQSSPGLKILDISNNLQLTNKSLFSISECKFKDTIEVLKASYNSQFSHKGVGKVLFHCNNIIELHFDHCPKINFIGMVIEERVFGIDPIRQYISRNITSLQLQDCPLQIQSLHWISSALCDLRDLNLSGVMEVNDSIVQSICLGCPFLQSVNLSGCKHVTSDGVSFFAACGCTNTLICLDISNIGRISDSTSVSHILRECKLLQNLSIASNSSLNEHTILTQQISPSKALKSFNLKSCHIIPAKCISVACYYFQHLEALEISGVALADDTCLKSIGNYCKVLVVFKACDCLSLSDTGLEYIAKGCLALKELHLGTKTVQTNAWGGRVTQYSDIGLRCILESCHHLLVLDFRNQCGITLQLHHWKRFKGHFALRKINLLGADNILEEGLVHVLRVCYYLDDVTFPRGEFAGINEADKFAIKSKQVKKNVAIFNHKSEKSSVNNNNASSAHSVSSFVSSTSLTASYDSNPTSLTKDHVHLNSPQILWKSCFPYCCYSTNHNNNKNIWGGLYPVDSKAMWHYRDTYINRQLLEIWAIVKIQLFYRFVKKYRWLCRWHTARVIQRFRRLFVRDRKLKMIRADVLLLLSVLRIQRMFRKVLPRFHKCIRIQSFFRGYLARLLRKSLIRKHKAATSIQRIVRGVQVRLSDNFILAQIYIKLPPFWKSVLKSTPPKDGIGSVESIGQFGDKVTHHTVANRLNEVGSLMKFIELKRTTELTVVEALGQDLNEEKKLYNLAPKMPFIVPQPFDKHAYVSLADGRKLSFFSNIDGLLVNDVVEKSHKAALAKGLAPMPHNISDGIIKVKEPLPGVEPVHQYTFRFWPLQFSKSDAVDISLFDPHRNGFDVVNNGREVLHCELCNSKLRVIFCKVCVKGFCFFCAFKAHLDGAKRMHAMDMVEPRVIVDNQASTSLVYHLDMVKKTTYDIKYLVNFMKSSTEVKRINNERKLASEMEEMRAKEAIAAQKAALESKERHDAATTIQNLFRKVRANKVVSHKRYQIAVEKAIRYSERTKKAAIMIQKKFRLFSVRIFFSVKVGLVFRLNRKKKKKRIQNKETNMEKKLFTDRQDMVAKRVVYDLHQRRLNARRDLFDDLYRVYSNNVQMIEENTIYWLSKLPHNDHMVQEYTEKLEYFQKQHRIEDLILLENEKMYTEEEYLKQKAIVKRLFLKKGVAMNAIEHLKSERWWMSHHIRGNCRRIGVMKARFADSMKRLEWVATEDFIVHRIRCSLEARLEAVKNVPDMEAPIEWFVEYIRYVDYLRVKFDALQETILTEDIRRYSIDEKLFKETNSLLTELLAAVNMDNQYAMERVFLDAKSFGEVSGSEEALSIQERSLALKLKQTRLNEHVIDHIKIGLDARLSEDEMSMVDVASFPTDDVNLVAEAMPSTITTELVDPFVPRKHFDMAFFIDILMSQPWNAREALEDVRLEELLKHKELDLDRYARELRATQISINTARKEISDRETQNHEIDKEIDILAHQADIDDDAKIERLNQMNLLQIAQDQNSAYVRMKYTDIENMELKIPVLSIQVDNTTIQVSASKLELERKLLRREKVIANYFVIEEKLCHDLVKIISQLVLANAIELKTTRDLARRAETGVQQEHDLHLLKGIADLDLQQTMKISNHEKHYEIQDLFSKLEPEMHGGGARLAQLDFEVRANVYNADLKYLQDVEKEYLKEIEILESFATKKKVYASRMQVFLNSELARRRQQALQKELESRVVRLQLMRNTRLAAIKAIIEKADEEEKIRLEKIAQEKEIERKSVVSKAAESMKKTIRNAADDYRKYKDRKNNSMTAEEEKMAAAMRRKKRGGGQDGISKIRITGSKAETEQFQRQNKILLSKGLPYYQMIERGIGSKGDVFLWIERSNVMESFITHIELGHTDPNNPLYKELDNIGYEKVSNPNLKLVIFVQRDQRKNTAVNDIKISYDVGEEPRYVTDGYEKISSGVSLQEFDLPDVYMWSHKFDKDDKFEAQNTNATIAELKAVKKMIMKKPGNQDLMNLEKKLIANLDAAYYREKETNVTNPLEYAVELLALSKNDLNKWMKIYAALDKRKEGAIGTDPIFEMIEEPATEFNLRIFHHLDSFNLEGKIEFGDFLRTFAVFCLFGKDEILRFMFTFADTSGVGVLTHMEFIKLLNQLHPFDKKRTKRALAEMDWKEDKNMTYAEFCHMNDILPNILYPAFRLQHQMRAKTMGDDWWFKKLLAYKAVRQKLKGMVVSADKAAEVEMKRVADDEARELRIKDRAQKIKQSSSAIQRVILNARQIADEFS